MPLQEHLEIVQADLQKVKSSLVTNLWHTINRESLEDFDSFAFLLELTQRRLKKKIIDLKLLTTYAKTLKEIYNITIYNMESIIRNCLGDMMEAEKVIKSSVDFYFSELLKDYFGIANGS